MFFSIRKQLVPVLFSVVLASVVVLYFSSSIVKAQVMKPLQKSITLDMRPAVPNPGEDVTFRAVSYDVNLMNSLITWSVNGEVVQSGQGQTTYSLTLGPEGATTVIRMTAQNVQTGELVVTERVLRPVSVGIFWEADSYTPPLYKGKRLHNPGGTVTFVVLSTFFKEDGSVIDPANLVYTWEIGGLRAPNISGYGKQRVTMPNTQYLRPLEVAVSVSTPDQGLGGRAHARVPVTQPYTLLYEQHPLLGTLYDRAITSTFAIREGEVTFVAEPFYYSASARDEEQLTYDWTVDRRPISAGSVITLRPEGAGTGSASLALTLKNTSNPLQSSRSTLSILFSTANESVGNPLLQ